jgi:hypothetical protein
MNGACFLYQSAKDVLKDFNLSRKRYIDEVMAVGRLLFTDIKEETKPMTGDDIDRLARALNGNTRDKCSSEGRNQS